MALKRVQCDSPSKVGYVSHASLVRIDRRVKDITRRQAALQNARRAAERSDAATASRGGI